jgi:hypothetical protein
MSDAAGDLAWTVRVPLLTNRLILKQMLLWSGISSLLIGLIFGGILMSEDGLEALPTVLLITSACFAILIVLAVLVMALFFFNRMTLNFRIGADGIAMATGDKKVRTANTLAIVLGALSGKPGAMGAGLVGRSQERDSVAWDEVKRWRLVPDLHAISVHRGFPGPLIVYALPEMFERVTAAFTARRPDARTP